MKKLILGISLILASFTATANDDLIIYKCDYRIDGPTIKDFKMSGNIITSDVIGSDEEYAITYLTLAPVGSSDIDIHARVLITAEGYSYMAFHAVGSTSNKLAFAELKGDRQDISYQDSEGNKYVLECSLRKK